MPAGLSLMKSILSPLAKGVLIPLGLSAGMSAADATIHKTVMDQVVLQTLLTTALIISNEEMEKIIKIVTSLEESELLIKRISKTIKNEAKGKKENFF